jgi:Icc protein
LNEIRIAQITDLHIPPISEHPFDTDPRSNLLSILEQVEDFEPHHIVLSGDLTFKDGDPESCEWIKNQLSPLDIPYTVIGGNHDSNDIIADVFECPELLKEGEIYMEETIHDLPVLFLDSAKGELSPTQKEWLNDSLQAGEGPAIVFVHHPPCHGGVPHMDQNYPLRDREAVLGILKHSNRPCHVFCGHYHVEKTLQIENVMVNITPSLFIQLSSDGPEFKIDHKIAGWRKISIKGNDVQSSVSYLA